MSAGKARSAEPLAVPVSAGSATSFGGTRTVPLVNGTVPTVGAYMNPKHQYWWNGKGPVPSVTTVLGIIDKPAIVVWKAKGTANAVIDNWPQVQRIVTEQGQDAAVKWAMGEADLTRDAAANLGSSVHLLADIEGIGSGIGDGVSGPEAGNAPQGQERAVGGFQVSEGTLPYLEAYRGFLDRYTRSAIVSSEHMVWSLNGYAGTYDLLMEMPCEHCRSTNMPDAERQLCKVKELWLLDIKTSGKGPYPEWGLQLAAYRWADSIVLPNNPSPYPMPLIKRTGVLHLQPALYKEGWALIEYPTTERDYIAFLGALEVYTWKSEGRFTKAQLRNGQLTEVSQWRKP